MPIQTSTGGNSLVDIIDRVLDKGLVINADISISIVNTELLTIKIKAAIASFETAAKYGMEFPSGMQLNLPAWQEALAGAGQESYPGQGVRLKSRMPRTKKPHPAPRHKNNKEAKL